MMCCHISPLTQAESKSTLSRWWQGIAFMAFTGLLLIFSLSLDNLQIISLKPNMIKYILQKARQRADTGWEMLWPPSSSASVFSLPVQRSDYTGGSPKNNAINRNWSLLSDRSLFLGMIFTLLHITMKGYEKQNDWQGCLGTSITPPARFNQS